jgi:hypothetical protein
MKVALVLTILALIYSMVQNRFDDKYQAGYAAGLKEALKTNPPSEELEMVCAGLWVGEQNRRYFNKGLK